MSVRILWTSRHKPLKAQLEELARIYGEYELKQYSGFVPNAEWLVEYVKKHGFDVVVPVLPLTIIAEFVQHANREGVTVLWAEMKQVKMTYSPPVPGRDYNPEWETVVMTRDSNGVETWKVMRFVKFHRILGVELKLEPVGNINIQKIPNMKQGETS
ncbi:MAG: hypothetical protein DRP11_00500 [Candidatus Aenigmatarchaeota archaeon]|nr:MAG: hypothetical protein DRP11_00500 [Candidatus Aenigmarchaeota archaeon]